MVASRSRGHRWGLSGLGGSTRWRGAWGGVEMIRGGLERAVCGGSGRPERNDDGSPDTGSSEGNRGGVSWRLNDGGTMAQWR
jgi:hypothetical protein